MKKVLGRIFWVIIILLMCLWTFEFYRVRNGKEPMFTFKKGTHKYTDGSTDYYIGLGYKVYSYSRDNLYGSEFVSIFAKERNNTDSMALPDLPSKDESNTNNQTNNEEQNSDSTNTEENNTNDNGQQVIDQQDEDE